MGLSQEIISSGTGVSKEAVGGLTVGVFAIGSLFKAIKKVSTGEMGVRTSFGKAKLKNGQPTIEGPGLHWIIPFTHGIEPVDVRDQSTDLGELFVDRDEQYRVVSSINWRVSADGPNPYRARYLTENLLEIVTNISVGSLRTTMTNIEKEKMQDSAAVSAEVKELCGEPLIEYGVELLAVNLHSVARSMGEMLRPINGLEFPSAGTLAVVSDPTGGLAAS